MTSNGVTNMLAAAFEDYSTLLSNFNPEAGLQTTNSHEQ
jgi:hypothetical protein